MARRKKKKKCLKQELTDYIVPVKKPEDFMAVGSAVWWEANPDKSKKYGRKEFKRKKFLTPKEAEMFLEISGNWLSYFVQGKKGFPKLPYEVEGKNASTIKFARSELVKYREMLRAKKFSTKARPQNK